MANLSSTGITVSGSTMTLAAAAGGGDTVPTGDRHFLAVANGGGGSITVTIASVQTCNQGGTHNLAVAVGAGVTKLIGPLGTARFGDTAAVTYSGVTTVTVGSFVI